MALGPAAERVAAWLADERTVVVPARHRRRADDVLVEVELAAAGTAAAEEQVVVAGASGSVDLADSYSFIIPIARKLRYALSLSVSHDDREEFVR